MTVEQLLAERQAWESEREQLLRRQEMDSREIVRLSKLIGALRQKLFGTGRGEKVDHAQLEIQLGLTRNRGQSNLFCFSKTLHSFVAFSLRARLTKLCA